MWEREPFSFAGKPRLIGGDGAVAECGSLFVERGVRRIFCVVDPGVFGAGLAEGLLRSLDGAGLVWELFTDVRENPDDVVLEACVEKARAFGAEGLVGLGGGSSMDTAKGANFLLTHGGRIHDYWGRGKARLPMLPMVAVPTTTGTGSECQSFAIITDSKTHQKMACGDDRAFPMAAILDPVLTLTQPGRVRAACGIDALSHALESMVSRRANPFSQSLSREAFRLIATSLEHALRCASDLEAHRNLQLGAALAGMAIEASMLGAAHAMANPLTARHGTVHGEAVGLVLPTVVRYNGGDAACAEAYRALAVAAGWCGDGVGAAEAVEVVASTIEGLRGLGGMPGSLEAIGVEPDGIEPLAASAMAQWTRDFNPRSISQETFDELYRCLLR